MQKKTEKFLTIFCFVIGLGIIFLNFSLAFDHVLWGDEAFSANVIKDTNAFGIYQRVYYWDSHPPLYYYWLKLVTLCLGESVFAYHVASLIPFIISMALILFPIRKILGIIPSAFFMVICGLSSITAEYHLEVRMYELCFMFILVCVLSSYRIMCSKKICYWVVMTFFALLAAYTHYYGLVVAGLILFYTGLIYFLRHKGRSWCRGVLSIVAFVVCYAPWLYVFYLQTVAVQGSNWLTEVGRLKVLLRVLFCGDKLYPILLYTSIILTIYVIIRETDLIYFTYDRERRCVKWHINKPNFSKCSEEFYGIILGWAVEISTVLFTYLVSWFFTPLTVGRYMYPLVPISLFVFVLLINRFVYYTEHPMDIVRENEISWTDVNSEKYKKMRMGLVFVLFSIITILCLFDFKYYRSKSKTEEMFTKITLETIGQPNEDAVMIGNSVPHLSWTVLPYYYPNNRVEGCPPDQLGDEPGEIWAFLGYQIPEYMAQNMEVKGYKIDCWEQMWLGKYGCTLYHFYK